MNKNYFYVLIYLFFMGAISAQDSSKPMTIKANEFSAVTLFFPTAIERVIPPSSNYKFEYDTGKTLGTLKARQGIPSNLTVITNNGDVFSFMLNYSAQLDSYIYMINASQAVGQVKQSTSQVAIEEVKGANDTIQNPSQQDRLITEPDSSFDTSSLSAKVEAQGASNTTSEKVVVKNLPSQGIASITVDSGAESDLYESDSDEYYRIFCDNNYLQKSIYKRSFRQNNKIIVTLNNILIDRDEIYFMLALENTSKREYKVNGLGFFLKDNQKDNASILKPRYTYNLQTVIYPESTNEVAYVFKKFSMTENQIIEIVLDEKEGSRMVILPLNNKYLNKLSK